ncbi:hypothetical protein B0J13DRAFT_110989 [Dactylonectria estremocensis]|uniref:Uncharacterized protein n=1 Tax=Dactylonectria estremocensis TaxID=1079267 RepID=A0A9P9FDJ0_9HYPO|nr:hypothetical protein B0J13DRAFT_110989 [Dactylonectria estremocensis]
MAYDWMTCNGLGADVKSTPPPWRLWGSGDDMADSMACVGVPAPRTAGDTPVGGGVMREQPRGGAASSSRTKSRGEGCAEMDQRGPWEPLDQGADEYEKTRACWRWHVFEALVLFGGGIKLILLLLANGQDGIRALLLSLAGLCIIGLPG